jgi:hypothetical protein
MRELLTGNKDLAQKLEEMDTKYENQFRLVFELIGELMAPTTPPPNRQIGFLPARKR